ncbi:MAG TPA: dipeptidase [Pseudonocardiaceae bacterium]|jgi:acetylornithine deacetylase/succinyl-diaminopimelate desuccinylase-like protein|nr:dipeptidase [Pseudonocardiaceae bacterium]
MREKQLRAAVDRELPAARKDLERLVRIPGIAFPGFDPAQLDRCADAVAELLRGCGLAVETVAAGGGPAVIGVRPAPPGAPTVLLYAHYDVQPPGDAGLWDSDPFEPVERDGRLYGRGAADDKAGLMAHLVALRALGDELPVGVVVFVEGEEENGSESLPELLARHRDALRADVVVIADSINWAVGTPALTTSLRGIVNCVVTVRTLRQAVHSGLYGGPVPDALTALAHLLATCHDSAGNVVVDGLVADTADQLDLPDDRLRAEAGMVEGVEFIGSGSLVDRLWTRPALSVIGIDAPSVDDAANALVPVARAKLSLRLAPGDDPDSAFAALRKHCAAHRPWGASVTVEFAGAGAPSRIDTSSDYYQVARSALRDAWDGVEPAEIGIGGSIPAISAFLAEFPGATVVVTGVEDPQTHAHGPNESLHLGEFARVCLAEVLLLTGLAQPPVA